MLFLEFRLKPSIPGKNLHVLEYNRNSSWHRDWWSVPSGGMVSLCPPQSGYGEKEIGLGRHLRDPGNNRLPYLPLVVFTSLQQEGMVT